MRRILTLVGAIAALAAGVTAAVALGAGTSAPDTSTETTTAVAGGATTTSAPSKVWVCHHPGSWKQPYHLIHISTHALPAHMRHGDVTPGADNSCPTTQPAGTKTHGRGNGQSNNAKTKDDNSGKGDDETETNDD
jgi:hypothetical protein